MGDEADTFEALQAELREAYEAGQKEALLQAIQHAITFYRPIPAWAAEEFEKAFFYVRMGGANSWDDVFGKPHPKGKHLHRIVLENRKFGVHQLVRRIHEQEGVPIGDALFERVGRKTGRGGKTVIAELYGEVEQLLRRLNKKD